jgi:TRAP-type C4-dicarboxylate transport system substrate-binding protein
MSTNSRPAGEPDQPIELRFAVWGVGGETRMNDTWMDEVEKRTLGKLHFTRYYFSAGRKMEADVFNDVPMVKYPLLDLIQTPYIIPDSSVGSRVIAQLYSEFVEFRDELKEVKTVGLGTGALMCIISSKAWGPIRKLEDMKGARIRSLPPIDAALSALGAIPLHPGSFEEFGQKLETGGLDAALIGVGLVQGRNLVRQAPYCTIGEGPSLSMHPMRTFMKWEAWNSLPSGIQKIIEDIGPNGGDCWYAIRNGAVFDQTIPESSAYINQNGGEIITLPKHELARWIDVLQPLREKNISALEALGLPGRKYFNRLLELVQKYST